jgi:hypothetical protein
MDIRAMINMVNNVNNLNEVVGVVENVFETSTKIIDKLYSQIIDYVKSKNLSKISIRDTDKLYFVLNMDEIFPTEKQDVILKTVRITINFTTFYGMSVPIAILSMSNTNPDITNLSKKGTLTYGTQSDAVLDMNYAIDGNITFLEFVRFLISKKNMNVDTMSHELKHYIDYVLNPYANISDRTHYSMSNYFATENNYLGDLNDFCFLMYYIHDIESKVRPNELYSECLSQKITQSNFLEKFRSSNVYGKINEVKNLSYEKLFESVRHDLKNNINIPDYLLYMATNNSMGSFLFEIAGMSKAFMKALNQGSLGVDLDDKSINDLWSKHISKLMYSDNDDLNVKKTFEKMINKMKFDAERLYKKLSKLYSIIPKDYSNLTSSDIEKEYMDKLNLLEYW